MPCESSYLEPSYREVESKKMCKHIKYLFEKLKIDIPKEIKKGANSCYGTKEQKNDQLIMMLSNGLKSLSKKEMKLFVYNIHNKNARRLVDWWEDYQKKENKEDEVTKRIKKGRKQISAAMKRLRAEEVEIIEKYIDWDRLDCDLRNKEK